MTSRDDLARFRLAGWLSVLIGAALFGSGFYRLGDQYHPLAAVWWMLGGILAGTLLGFACFVVGCTLWGFMHRNRPPVEFRGMSAEQHRQLREHDRRRRRTGHEIH